MGRAQGQQTQRDLVQVLVHLPGSLHGTTGFTPPIWGWLLRVLEEAQLRHGFCNFKRCWTLLSILGQVAEVAQPSRATSLQ